jgi:hypothetical protein
MKGKYSLYVFYFFMAIILLHFFRGYYDRNLKESKTAVQTPKYQMKSPVRALPKFFSPLTFKKLESICNGKQIFSEMEICYMSSVDGVNMQIISTDRNETREELVFAYDNLYKGTLETITDEKDNFQRNYFKTEFSDNEINKILKYISAEDNRMFFLGKEDCKGLERLHQIVSIRPPERNYNFSLVFWVRRTRGNPGAWAIFQNVDTYPDEGTPLFGLYKMIEKDFCSQFKEPNKKQKARPLNRIMPDWSFDKEEGTGNTPRCPGMLPGK